MEDHGVIGVDPGDPDLEKAAVPGWANAHDRVVVQVPILEW
jgi:hypothetical protein